MGSLLPYVKERRKSFSNGSIAAASILAALPDGVCVYSEGAIVLFMGGFRRSDYLQNTCLPICVSTGLDQIHELVAVAGL